MFEFSLVTPAFLYGLAAIAIPIVIHFLFKARKQTVIFSSVQFILQSAVRKSSRIRFRELLLLLLRIAIFALIVLAFAKPFRPSAAGADRRRGSLDLVIVLDDSYSMGYRERGESRFDAAKRVALREMERLSAGDRVGVVRVTAGQGVVLEMTPGFDAAAAALRRIHVSAKTGHLASGVRRAASLLRDSAADRQRVVLVSDCQRVAWGSLETDLKELPKRIALDVARVGRGRSRNLAMLDIRVAGWGWVRGRPLQLVARVANYSGLHARDLSVSLHMHGRKVLERVFDVAPGDIHEVPLPCDTQDGEAVGWVQIAGSDPLPLDDRHFFRFAPEAPVRVLCVEEELPEVPYFQQSYYLRTALDPSTKRRPGPRFFAPELVDAASFDKEDLSAFRVICLINLSGPSEPQAQRLEQYVRGGGGVLIFLGSRAEPSLYSHRLYRQGTGLLPCRLGDPVKGLPTESWPVGTLDRGHAVFRPFRDAQATALSAARVEQLFTAAEIAPESARVLARTDEGAPLLLEKAFGRGRVLLFTSTADAEWTNLPKTAAYLPLVHGMVRYLAGGKQADAKAEIRVGDALRLSPDELPSGRSLTIVGPDGKPAGTKLGAGAQPPKAWVIPTDAAGLYVAIAEPAHPGGAAKRATLRHFAVNLDKRESDLTSVSSSAIQSVAREYTRDAAAPGLAKAADRIRLESTGDAGPGLWRALLIAALMVMLVELILANRVGA